MHWKLPVLLCIISIGFSICQDETTPEPQEDITLPDIGGEKDQPASPVPQPTKGDVEETTIKIDPIETTTTHVIVTTTEEEVITTTAPPVFWTGEPCDTTYVLDQAERHFSATVGKEPVNDITLMENWYRFELQGTPAIITSQPIKPEQCGTNLPFHLDLRGKQLPAENSNGTYHICSTVKSDHGVITCSETQDIEVKNCGNNKYVYKLSPLKTSTKATAGICVQKPIEIVPLHFIAFAPEKSKLDVPTTSVDDVTKEQLDGIVTLELEYPEPPEKKTDTEILSELDKMYRPMVVEALNGAPKPTQAETKETTQEPMKDPVAAPEPVAPAKESPPAEPAADDKIPNNMDTDADGKGPSVARLVANPRFLYKRELRRQKRSADHEYKVDDVHYVGPTPRIRHGVLQKSIYVDDPETKAVDGDRLLAAVKGLKDSGKLKKLGLNVKDIYKGLPTDIQPLIAPVAARSTWKEHEPVFITIIVLLLLLLLILLIGCCCIKCRNRRGSWTVKERPKNKGKKSKPSPKKPLTAHESPYPDDEIKRDEGNMTERENPAYTANGSGGHIAKPTKDDEQGWIVPYEELNRAERNRPDVQDTKL